ncbi:multi-sensor signal transduction histidine kinase [Haladaptatus paucihalophilus DX253]|uniref:histidine kinase n=1 Tax=Haladaptatus paucihalophilus DX253 TaxID=797209 RepID=E7QP57_HALPU|nr:GAF domain-containing sensor histidine kinase [Haladaptatus paucihalophilus]EFW93973.1 multi-sensor signal transduction histidine kinase [Haladaptatus paucihalophilus DX253]SHK65413.1 Signal transduction histidine kinase [Haladaptatus paucihalophilus DX253]
MDKDKRTEHAGLEADSKRDDPVLTDIYRVITDTGRSFERKVEALLEIGRDVLGTEFCALSAVDGEEYVFEFVHDPTDETEAGDVVPVAETNCQRTIDTGQTVALADIAAEAPEMTSRAGFTDMGVRCYIGTPVVIDDDVYGTVCFYDNQNRIEEFTQWEITLVELIGKWIGDELERDRREAELTRRRNRLAEFETTVTHDLRTPIHVAQAYVEFARKEHDTEHLDGIEDALDRIEALIDDARSLTDAEANDIDATAVDLEHVVVDAWVTTANDTITLEVEDGLEPVVGSHSHLQRAFENLIRNTVEHADTGATIRVGTLPDRPGFYFEDDGHRLSTDEHGQVFHPNGTDDDTGLGTVREIIDAHGWSIAVTDGTNDGVRFEIDDV